MRLSKNNIYIFLAIIITLVNNFVLPYFKLTASIQILISELALLGVSIIAFWIINSKIDKNNLPLHQTYCINKSTIIRVMIVIPCIIACGLLSLIISDSIVILSGGIVNLPNNTSNNGLEIFLIIFSTAFVPSIMEELWYRKIPLELNSNPIILLATMSFLANHQGISSIVNAFIVALSTIYIFKLTKCIYICMGVHFLFNLSLTVENNVTQFLKIDNLMKLFMSKTEHIIFLVFCIFLLLLIFLSIIFMLKPIESNQEISIKKKYKVKIIEVIAALFFIALTVFNLIF